ncbi:signal peptidase II [Nocardioides fonticola]|uniref:Lipoprotein signal peptidase n=1 Tax=Nocardioides fonticola TaxID=450363 RepID=A0ABP7X9F3_9ACTN
MIVAVVALLAYAVDVVTKLLAVEHLTGRADVQLVGEILQLRLTRNPGAAFSTGTGYTSVLSIAAIVAVIVIVWLSRRVRNTVWAFALGLLLAGVSGNLTDRLLRAPGPLRGHVVDFLMLPNWPIFNVADICINVAAGLILLQAFRGVRLDGTRAEADDADDADDAAAGPGAAAPESADAPGEVRP